MTDQLEAMIESFAKLASDIDPDNAFIKGFKLQQKLRDYLIKIVKDRSIVLTGDTGHMSIAHIIDTMLADIDKPRKYDFQDVDVHEKDVYEALVRIGVNASQLIVPYTEEQLDAAIAGTAPLTFQIKNYDGYKCYDCTAPLRLTINGFGVHIDAATPCENNKLFSVEIDFPTGEVVFGDWPDRFSEAKAEGILVDDNEESINYIKGQRQSTDNYATKQIFHHSVGNSSPSWYYNKDTQEIRIGGEIVAEEPEDEDEEWDEDGVVPEGFEKQGYFCTDLWWVTMLDKKFYDQIIALIPGPRPKNGWEKDVEIGHVAPGRYRFTCYGDTGSDDYGSGKPYATAVRIGDCSGEEPNYSPGADKIALTAEQAILMSAAKYPILYNGEYEHVKFCVLDQVFNVLGNGINSKGDFIEHYTVKATTVIPTEFKLVEGDRPDKWGFERQPYPNFDKKYSLVWRVRSLDFLDDTWIDAAIWFYNECKEYFKGDAANYSYAYPNKRKNTDGESEVKQFTKIIGNLFKEGMTTQQHWDAVTNHFIGDTEYKGDVEDYLQRRWIDAKVGYIKFIDETLAKLAKERKSVKRLDKSRPI